MSGKSVEPLAEINSTAAPRQQRLVNPASPIGKDPYYTEHSCKWRSTVAFIKSY